jgi:CheY-like chemotaxis protein
VLVVDDEAAVDEFMSTLLEDRGLEVTAMDGHSHRARHLRRDPALSVVLYAGYREALDDDAINKIGGRAVVRKPVDTEELHALLSALLTGCV